MGRYKEVNAEAKKYGFNKIAKQKVIENSLLKDAPQDYKDFLLEVGFGSVSDSYFMFYSGLIEADEIYDASGNPVIKQILLFGDNFSGDAMGFLPHKNWAIVEIWHEDLYIWDREETSFYNVVKKAFAKNL